MTMSPELMEQKKKGVRVVFNSAIHDLDTGRTDPAFESLHKLLGMQAAFHLLDDDLYDYAELAVKVFVEYVQAYERPARRMLLLNGFLGNARALQ